MNHLVLFLTPTFRVRRAPVLRGNVVPYLHQESLKVYPECNYKCPVSILQNQPYGLVLRAQCMDNGVG